MLRVPPTQTTPLNKSQSITISSQSTARTTTVATVNGTSGLAKVPLSAPKVVTATGVKPSATLIGPASRKRAFEAEARNRFISELSLVRHW